MKESQLRQLIREEAQKVLNERGYDGPGSHIFDDVMQALQRAEEGGMFGGISDDHQGYLELMNAIQKEIENRKQALKRHSNQL